MTPNRSAVGTLSSGKSDKSPSSSKWSSTLRLRRPVMSKIWRMSAAASSSTTYCKTGLRPNGSISLGWALVKGKRREPMPATGTTAFRTVTPLITTRPSCLQLFWFREKVWLAKTIAFRDGWLAC
jgi:hypothetical protein